MLYTYKHDQKVYEVCIKDQKNNHLSDYYWCMYYTTYLVNCNMDIVLMCCVDAFGSVFACFKTFLW